jgi:pilus assembly protein Flp/PilA
MTNRSTAIKRRITHEQGQGLVEYALILALVSLAAILALTFLSGKINDLFSKTGNSLNTVQVASGGSGGPSGPPPVDTAPTVSSFSVNTGGNNRVGDGDTITVVFSEALSLDSFCSGAGVWDGSSTLELVIDSNDTLYFSSNDGGECPSGDFQFGTITLGGNFQTDSNRECDGTSVSFTGTTLSITVGSCNSDGSSNTPGQTTVTYSPDSDLRDQVDGTHPVSGGGSTGSGTWF